MIPVPSTEAQELRGRLPVLRRLALSRAAGILVLAWLVPPPIDAQVGRGAGRGLRTAAVAVPAPILEGARQVESSIWPQLTFRLPPDVTGIRVFRQQAGAQPQLVTPTGIPISVLKRYEALWEWTDATLAVVAPVQYAIVADFRDGRQSTSTSLTYTPQLYEPTDVRALKTGDGYTVQIHFFGSTPVLAEKYRVFGTRLPLNGVEATLGPAEQNAQGMLVYPWVVRVTSLPAGTHQWTVRAEYKPGLRSAGVPVSVTMP